ncbi:MAG TPA: phage terminase large subunit family protein, partial [Nitrospiraceae bacterium]|nr:phage terminase large subunit family protein [Nitrospiraceae bacterium]
MTLKLAKGSGRLYSTHYLKSRMNELATATIRGMTEPLADWALQKIVLGGRRFSFEGHEYLKDLYDETAQHIVLMKGAQVGGTIWGLLRSIHACMNGLTTIYYFPTKTDVLEFSKARVSPLIDENQFLSEIMNNTNTAGVKRIGAAPIYFRGMQSPVGLKSVPADMLVFDELDESDPHAKAMAKERLAHSDYKWVIELSNPSIPDYGIDEMYQQSDQRHWTLKCPGCGEWVCLDREFPKRLGEEVRIILPRGDGTFYRACPTCQKELDLAQGQWVPVFPRRKIHGYAISQMISSKVDPGDILREYLTTTFAGNFYNMKLGMPYSDLELKLDTASVLLLCSD